MKKTKSPVIEPVTDQDLVSHSLDDMLTKTYGPKGSTKRTAAQGRIKALGQTLEVNNSLKELRELCNKTQAQVASIMHVDGSVVSKLEKNFEKSQLSTILRYAKALNVAHVSISFEFANKKLSQVLELTPQ